MTMSMRGDHFRSEVETVDIVLERRFEYDMTFMRDRFVYLARSGGRQGYSAVALAPGMLEEHGADTQKQIAGMLPDMRRTAIDGALDLGYEKDLRDAERRNRILQEQIDYYTRPRWWHPVTEFATRLWWQVKATFR